MKVLILGLLAMVLLAAGSRRDCFWQWRSEARERARQFRVQQRDQMRAFRDNMREERDRIRRQIRDDLRNLPSDWRYTY